MKRILVPVDFSEYSRYAINFAVQLATKTGSEIHLLHVIEAPTAQSFTTMGMVYVDDTDEVYFAELRKVVKAKLESFAGGESSKGVVVIPKVYIGKPYENISEHIASHSADLIVMGTKGSSGLKELLVGSNTEKVVRFSKCPVIAIPVPLDLNKLSNIVFAMNMMDDEGRVIEAIRDFQNLTETHLSLLWVNTLHIIENEQKVKNEMEITGKKYGLTDFSVHVVKSVSAESGIMNYAEKSGADLIAMATHSRHGIAHIFSGSLAEDIVNHAEKAVWTCTLRT